MTTPPPPPNVTVLLATVGRLVRKEAELRLSAQGTSLRQISALGHLSRQPGLSYSELARRSGITVQSMQATLRQLQDAGAVEGTEAGGRGRAARLRVTAHGRDLLDRGFATMADTDRVVLADVPADHHADLAATLLRIARSMERG